MASYSRAFIRGGWLASLALLFLAGSGAWASDDSTDCQGGPLLVKIHADWCGSCKASKATWARVEKELAPRAIVIEFDVSDRVAYEQSLSQAQALGVEEFFREYRSQTGTVAVLACDSKEPITILQAERDFEKYKQAVEKASRPS